MHLKRLHFFALVVLLTLPVVAQADKVDDYVRAQMERQHVPGVSRELEPIGTHKQVNHGGSLPGFRAQLARFIDDKVTVVVLTNGDNANAGGLAVGVANFYIPGLLPEHKLTRVDPKVFDGHVGQYQREAPNLVSIIREGDKLILQQGESRRELLPESETSFFVPDNPRNGFSFVKDANGQAYFVITVDGKEVWRGKKIK